MVAKICGQEINCTLAVKGPNYVRLYNERGDLIVACNGISDFAGYALEGGDWTQPAPLTPTPTEQLRADVDYLAIMTGVSL